MKILFLDFNPLLPLRAAFLKGQTDPMRIFDPIAVGFLNRILERAKCQVVITSDLAIKGKAFCQELLNSNGIDPKCLHSDWETPRKFSSARSQNIRWWLEAHPEIKQDPPQDYVILDNFWGDRADLPQTVKTSFNNGLLFEHYHKILKLLGVAAQVDQDEPGNNDG